MVIYNVDSVRGMLVRLGLDVLDINICYSKIRIGLDSDRMFIACPFQNTFPLIWALRR